MALLLFAHGSGSSRHSPRNQFVARTINRAGLGTLLFDLLTPEEEALDVYAREHRFNIGLLAERLVHATNSARQQTETRDLRIGYFGSSTGGAAALVAAAELPQDVGAVVSRGGRPDLAGDALSKVQAPTLLIVGGNDDIVIELNERARDQMRCEVKWRLFPTRRICLRNRVHWSKWQNWQAIGSSTTRRGQRNFFFLKKKFIALAPDPLIADYCSVFSSVLSSDPPTLGSPDACAQTLQLHDLAVGRQRDSRLCRSF